MCNGTFVCIADAVRLRKSNSVTSFPLTIRADMLRLEGKNRAVWQSTCSRSPNDQMHFGIVATCLYILEHDLVSVRDGCLRVEFCAAHER